MAALIKVGDSAILTAIGMVVVGKSMEERRRFRHPDGWRNGGGWREKKKEGCGAGGAAATPRNLNDYYGPAPFRCEQSEATEPLSFSAVMSFSTPPFRRKRSAAAESPLPVHR